VIAAEIIQAIKSLMSTLERSSTVHHLIRGARSSRGSHETADEMAEAAITVMIGRSSGLRRDWPFAGGCLSEEGLGNEFSDDRVRCRVHRTYTVGAFEGKAATLHEIER
jgi:hypothetical protein